MTLRFSTLLTLALLIIAGAGCQTLKEMANLRNVAFSLDNVSGAQLAGIDVQRIQDFESLRVTDVARLTAAIARKDLPFDFTLHINAENPSDNKVNARMVRMDWTLLLDDNETLTGVFDQNIVLPPGEPTDLAIPMQLNLVEFFDKGARDLVELALAVSGQGGSPKRIKLQAIPTIDTPAGPIRYPNPITIVSSQVGTR